MTIAACYVASEGIVFGADSTTTVFVPAPGDQPPVEHHLNFAQKIFEIGDKSTLAITTWGLGSLFSASYRTLIANLADSLAVQPPANVNEVAWRWNQLFWSAYSSDLAAPLQRAKELFAKPVRSPEEDAELRKLDENSFCGFCIGGHVLPNRLPEAYEIRFHATMFLPEPPIPLERGRAKFWGWQNLIERVLWGVDDGVFGAVLASGKWTGSEAELAQALLSQSLGQPHDLPLREAIDWIHASIYTTIKAIKFSHWRPYCGGPIELAVISTDRRFRWVRHKDFGAAIC